jgi:hypothetical protein
MWWGKRKKRGTRLSRELALGMLQDAMGRAEEQQGAADPAADPQAASETVTDIKGQLPAQRRPERPAPRSAGPGPSAPPAPRSEGSSHDRQLC